MGSPVLRSPSARSDRRLHAAVAVLLAASLLAGCVTSSLGGEGITAKDAAARTQGRARDWMSDAFLFGVGSQEAKRVEGAMDARVQLIQPADAVVGDGRAPVWLTAYYSPSTHEGIAFAVFANGTILAIDDFRHEASGSNPAPAPLNHWAVDSPRVMEVLRGVPEVAEALAAEDAQVGMGLGMPGAGTGPNSSRPTSDPVWGISVFSPSRRVAVQAVVGATSPDVLSVARVNLSTPGFPGGMGPIEVPFQGSVSAARDQAEQPFEVPEGYTVLQMTEYQTQPTLPMDDAIWEVLDPQGTAIADGAAGSGFGAELAGPGTYALVVHFRSEVPPAPVGGDLRDVQFQGTLELR